MKDILRFSILLFFLNSCGSPMNNRTNIEPNEKSKHTELNFKKYSLNVEFTWILGPVGNIKQDNQLLVVIKDKEGKPKSLPNDLSLGFYSNMESMGHPLDEAGDFEDLGYGIYLNNSIRFNMTGDWLHEIRIMDGEFNILDKVSWKEFF
jgi:hypothetical protein